MDYVCQNGDIDANVLVNKVPFTNVMEIFGQDTQAIGKYVKEIHEAIAG